MLCIETSLHKAISCEREPPTCISLNVSLIIVDIGGVSALARQIGELEKTKELLLCEKEVLAVGLDVCIAKFWTSAAVDVGCLRDSAMLPS